MHLSFQSFEQCEPYLRTIIGGAKTWLVHGGLLIEDATTIASNVGKRLYTWRSTSRSTGSVHETESHAADYDYLVQPWEIRDLPADQLLVLSLQDRETAPLRTILKEPPLPIKTVPYREPVVPETGEWPAVAWEVDSPSMDSISPLAMPVSVRDTPEQHATQDRQPRRAANW